MGTDAVAVLAAAVLDAVVGMPVVVVAAVVTEQLGQQSSVLVSQSPSAEVAATAAAELVLSQVRLQAAVPPDFEPACRLQPAAAAAVVASACVLQATVHELVASWALLHLRVLQQVGLPVHFAWWSRSLHPAAVVVVAAFATPVCATSFAVAVAGVESVAAAAAVVEASIDSAAVLTGSAESAAG